MGEVADIIGGGTPSTLNLDYWDGNIDWYSPAEIIDQIYVYRSQRKITELGFEKSSAKMLPEGTVLFTSRAGIGKTAILAKRGCTNQGFQSIVPYSNKLDSYFIFSRTEELKKYGELVGAGSTFVEVSGRQMGNMQLMIPKTIGEQHIIGLLFSTLDHLITLHRSKFFGDILKTIASYALYWEQRKLGEVFEEYSEKNHSELPPLAIIQGGGTIRRDESDRALQYDRNSLSNYKMVNKGDFIVHLRSFEGGLEKANSTGIVSPAYHTFSGENTDTTFYYAYFRSEKFIESDLKPHVYGIRDGRSIDVEGMKSINIPYTIFDEQRRIGEFINSINHLITLHQSKLDKLQKIKKSMLESMFV